MDKFVSSHVLRSAADRKDNNSNNNKNKNNDEDKILEQEQNSK